MIALAGSRLRSAQVGQPPDAARPLQFFDPADGQFRRAHGRDGNSAIILSGQKVQCGIEAIIPATPASGKNIGGIAQIHVYRDDIFPQRVGDL